MIGISRIALLLALAACQSGDTKRADPPPPAPVHVDAGPPPVAFTRGLIAVGMGYGCVRTHGETLTCWGRSFPNTPKQVAGVAHVAGVVAAQARTCAWTMSGAVYCLDGGAPVLVEGIDDAIEMATDSDAFVTCARRKSGHVACWSDFDKPPVHDVEGISGALEIAVAGTTLCVRDVKGVACWHPHDPVVRRIANTADVTSLAGGHFMFAAIRKGQPPIAWHESDYSPLVLPALNANVHQFALGGDAACALGTTVQCWDLASGGKPYEIAASGATEIAVGYSLGCARMTDHVACWGADGSLGDGSPVSIEEPVDVANLSDATQIVLVGDEQTCALRANGHSVCWGATDHAQTDPAPVEYPSARKYFRATPRAWSGSYQRGSWTCTKKAEHVTCMMTFYGRHDDGVSTSEDETWGNLDTARDIRMPSNESGDVCVADAHGDVACFPAFEGSERSASVDGVSNVVQLAEYGEQSCALEQSGSVKCWNEREREYTGGKVRTLTRISDGVQIVGGSVHACARHKTGTVSCWGYRTLLGDNHDIHQRTPLVVAGITL